MCDQKAFYKENIYFFAQHFEWDLKLIYFPLCSTRRQLSLGRTGYGIRAKCWRRSTSLESASAFWVQSIFEIEFLSQSKISSHCIIVANSQCETLDGINCICTKTSSLESAAQSNKYIIIKINLNFYQSICDIVSC